MFPDGFDPYSEKSDLRSPLCVFVEFDSVDLGLDENGLSFWVNGLDNGKAYDIEAGNYCFAVSLYIQQSCVPLLSYRMFNVACLLCM